MKSIMAAIEEVKKCNEKHLAVNFVSTRNNIMTDKQAVKQVSRET